MELTLFSVVLLPGLYKIYVIVVYVIIGSKVLHDVQKGKHNCFEMMHVDRIFPLPRVLNKKTNFYSANFAMFMYVK